MDRRRFVQGSTALAAFMAVKNTGLAIAQETPTPSTPFSFEWLIKEAGRIAAEPYATHAEEVPETVRDLTYDQYRAIWFKPEAAIWANQPTQFRLDLFHLGFVYQEPVAIALVEDGQATDIPFDPSLFAYGHIVQPPETTEGMGFSGFRARYPINTPDAFQEFAVFQGASYFRAVGRDQIYGLSARGLAINTAEPEGEEFPAFRKFWIERPAPGSSTLVVYALLDSAFATGAYRFEITPGAETVMDVTASLFLAPGDQEDRHRASHLDVHVRRHEPRRFRRFPPRRARFRRPADAERRRRVDLAAALESAPICSSPISSTTVRAASA